MGRPDGHLQPRLTIHRPNALVYFSYLTVPQKHLNGRSIFHPR
jgi:hypothetical protein